METSENRLGRAASGYLRSARHQPVRWREWGEEAFLAAQTEDKPMLLDVGAVWCHWCHVMDRESYEDATTASLINQHFIPVKVDRDERPDVDARYQSAVSAISGQGGWPLTVFLTPDGRPFFGGTYFPPEDRHGRPSFQHVLLTMADAFQNRREEVVDSATSVMAAIEHNDSFAGRAGDPGPELVGKIIESALGQFDKRFGGFGSQPKFPHSSAIDLLLDAGGRVSVADRPDLAERAQRAAVTTLRAMARGGIYDHLAGGFHRYSVDERWAVPHFEKMSYDNCALLRNYVHAFQSTTEPEFAQVAREIIGWMDACLTDRDLGGFYASQDADFSLDDDGDFFTWTKDEAGEALRGPELALATSYFHIAEVGNMHHNPAKNVLRITDDLKRAAALARVDAAVASELLASAKQKLYAARLNRPTPYIDKTVYTAWNGMSISAYFEAARVLNMPEIAAFARLSVDRLLREAFDPGTGVRHVVAYGDGGGATATPVPGLLDDYVFLAHAALDAWEATAELRYYEVADQIAQMTVDRFYDRAGAGFFDTQRLYPGDLPLGALGTRRKPLQDSPTPAGNPAAAALLLRLESLNGREDYLNLAQETLESFAGIVEHFGLYAASYGLALQRLLQRSVHVCVIGDGPEAKRMEAVALERYAVNKSVVRFRVEQLSQLPPTLAKTLPHLPDLPRSADDSAAVVCGGHHCKPPVRSAEDLLAVLNSSL